VFAGGRLVLYAFVEDVRPTTVRLTATAPSGQLVFDVAVDPARTTPGRTVATLAARARIRELEESPEWTSARGSRQKARKENSISQEIVALSVRYGLISRETSFIAVERRDTAVHGDMQLRRVPIALTTGWGGLLDRTGALRTASQSAALLATAPSALRADMGPVPCAYDSQATERRLLSRAAPTFSRIIRQARASVDQVTKGSVRRRQAPAGMHTLVALQRADGSWDLTSELAASIGKQLPELETALAGATGNPEDVRRAWATALAVAWLGEHARSSADEWRLLADKARKCLDKIAATAPGGETWIDAATRFLRASG
jgi:Ca-activated chloride channel family protein